MSFHIFYSYSLSEDDSDCLSYLLHDYLRSSQTNDYVCRTIQDFVYFLLLSSLNENEALNLLIEAMYYLPRLDILYECTIDYKEYKEYEFGKFLNSKRVLLFKIFNESDEEEFQGCLNKIIISCESPGNHTKERSLFQNMEVLLNKWKDENEMKQSFDYFKKYHVKSNIPDIICRYKNYDKSKNIELKIPNQVEPKNIYVTLEKGDECCEPKFLYKSENGPKCFDFNSKERYPYPKEHAFESVCLIFNIRDYVNRERRGSEHDIEQIRNTFENLYFNVQTFQNSTKNEMFEFADIYSKVDKENSGSMFVCFILAHGEKDYIYDINDQLVSFRELSMKFSAKNCEAYRGKPKIFFIQACQGQKLQEGVSSEETTSPGYSVPQIEQDGCVKPEVKNYKKYTSVPEEADFIMGMATVSDCVAFRSVKKGSWYIRKLCKMIKEKASQCDLVHILTSVNYEVSKKPYKDIYCQLPMFCSTAMKKCYLTAPEEAS